MSEVTTPVLERQTARHHDEIVARLNYIRAEDFFGFQSSDLLAYLPWDRARPFLHNNSNEGDWRAAYPIFIPPLKAMMTHMPQAWSGANSCFKVNVMRSIEHIKAWLWLAGYDSQFIVENFDDCEYFGKPQFVLASHLIGHNWRDMDNGAWVKNSDDAALPDEAVTSIVTRLTTLGDRYKKE